MANANWVYQRANYGQYTRIKYFVKVQCCPHRILLFIKQFGILAEQTASALLCRETEEQEEKLKATKL